MESVTEMITFVDYYRNQVHLSFDDHPFSTSPKHVFVICRYKNQWLLTHHPRRGYEFPGGKVEAGEQASDAAVREVMEETGAVVSVLRYIGQYEVHGKGGLIIKNIYYAEIKEMKSKSNYFETNGPVLLEQLPGNIKENNTFSFMMKDEMLSESLKKVKQFV